MGRTKAKNISLLVLLTMLMAVLAATALSSGASGQVPTDLFMSEYVEGTSFNKAIEVYNATGATVDLGAQQYIIQTYFNGSTSPGLTINLAGTVVDGDVFVVAHASAAPAVLAEADMTTIAGWFNGNDAIVLRKGGAGGTITDRFGRVGEDPGLGWTGTGGVQTWDKTLRRKPTVYQGDTASADPFDPGLQWDMYDVDTFDGLGWHALVPLVDTVDPSAALNSGPVHITGIYGHFFQDGATAWLQKDAETINAENVVFVNSGQLACDFNITGSTPGDWTVFVQNPAPHGLASTSGTPLFTVNNLVPTTSGLNPDNKTAGDAGFTLTVNGTGLNTSSVVRWNGADRVTTCVSGTVLTAAIPPSDIAAAGTASVTVFNLAPGGGTSTPALVFTIKTIAINASASPVAGGTVTGAGAYNLGDTVNMQATANAGYHFVNWTEGGGGGLDWRGLQLSRRVRPRPRGQLRREQAAGHLRRAAGRLTWDQGDHKGQRLRSPAGIINSHHRWPARNRGLVE